MILRQKALPSKRQAKVAFVLLYKLLACSIRVLRSLFA